MNLPGALAKKLKIICPVLALAGVVQTSDAADKAAESAKDGKPESLEKAMAMALTLTFVIKVPPELEPLLVEGGKSYRDIAQVPGASWRRVTDFEFSAQHWKEGVVTYTNDKAYDVYRNNYYTYLRDLEFSCDSDDEDEPACAPDSLKYKPYPEGSVLLKEHFRLTRENGAHMPTGPLTATLMRKMPAGFDPRYGDWEFIEWDSEGGVKLRGKGSDKKISMRCAKCHAGVEERFLIFSDFLAASLLEQIKVLKKAPGK